MSELIPPGLEVLDTLLDELRALELEAAAGRYLFAVQTQTYRNRTARLAVQAAELEARLEALTGGPE